ncbi:SGNH/GDSL hydrolase family protein [Paenibacillus eucommiae]|uniref:Lysophospholipase L1-like esterase n=1 Tax=Paenibacillus eucommiae TaxID=1355755 RepID=A0ABS4IVX3_9BACL|nr:SGNH/GDSL hydrolase family protein [Paenibacillus eucommiae]MBP1991743.1 lysophospholipase L1-like esterase [Paenibacillus eucommiae]
MSTKGQAKRLGTVAICLFVVIMVVLSACSSTEGGVVSTNYWNGKKVNFIGDSITFGVGASVTENRFTSVTAKMLGLIETNYGIPSSILAVTAASPTDRDPIATRYVDMTDDADLVIVFAGTNDWWSDQTPLGTMSSRSNTDFYGALHNLCLGLLDKYVGKHIVFMTPIKRSYLKYMEPDAVNANGKSLMEYGDIIKEVCAYYSIPVLDLNRESMLNPYFEGQKSAFIPDGIHPNDAGHKLIAQRLVGYLKQLVSN